MRGWSAAARVTCASQACNYANARRAIRCALDPPSAMREISSPRYHHPSSGRRTRSTHYSSRRTRNLNARASHAPPVSRQLVSSGVGTDSEADFRTLTAKFPPAGRGGRREAQTASWRMAVRGPSINNNVGNDHTALKVAASRRRLSTDVIEYN